MRDITRSTPMGSKVLLVAFLACLTARITICAMPVNLRQQPWPIAVARRAFEQKQQAGYLAAVLDLLDREQDALADDAIRTP